MLFPVADGRVSLPLAHPLAVEGWFSPVALIECAAQLAGREVVAEPGHAGMLVEIGEFVAQVDRVAAGESLAYRVTLERTMGPLWRFRVELVGILTVAVTIRVG